MHTLNYTSLIALSVITMRTLIKDSVLPFCQYLSHETTQESEQKIEQIWQEFVSHIY